MSGTSPFFAGISRTCAARSRYPGWWHWKPSASATARATRTPEPPSRLCVPTGHASSAPCRAAAAAASPRRAARSSCNGRVGPFSAPPSLRAPRSRACAIRFAARSRQRFRAARAASSGSASARAAARRTPRARTGPTARRRTPRCPSSPRVALGLFPPYRSLAGPSCTRRRSVSARGGMLQRVALRPLRPLRGVAGRHSFGLLRRSCVSPPSRWSPCARGRAHVRVGSRQREDTVSGALTSALRLAASRRARRRRRRSRGASRRGSPRSLCRPTRPGVRRQPSR